MKKLRHRKCILCLVFICCLSFFVPTFSENNAVIKGIYTEMRKKLHTDCISGVERGSGGIQTFCARDGMEEEVSRSDELDCIPSSSCDDTICCKRHIFVARSQKRETFVPDREDVEDSSR